LCEHKNIFAAALHALQSHFGASAESFAGPVAPLCDRPLLAVPDCVIAGHNHSSQTLGQRLSLVRTIIIIITHVATLVPPSYSERWYRAVQVIGAAAAAKERMVKV
jgi:hypothetical protein